MIKPRHSLQKGFTLIEMIVSLGVFAVVVTITTGALLMLITTNQRFQYEQNIMSNLSFAIDSMTREMRMGYNYNCQTAAASTSAPFTGAHESLLSTTTNDCASPRPAGQNARGVSFYEGGDSITGPSSNRIMYFYDFTAKKIYRRVGDGVSQSLISDAVQITSAEFFVTGSGSAAGQPTITIYLKAKAAEDTTASPRTYSIQTTVSQRALDI